MKAMDWLRGATPLWFRGAGLGLCVVLVFVLGFLEPLERSWLDLQFTLRGAEPPQTPVVLISIGEDSFDELHQRWPWPRVLHARFLEILSRGHPAVIGLDVVFPEPSPFGPQDDLALGRAVRRAGNVILAATLTLDQGSLGEKRDMNPPIKPIREGAAGYGPVGFERDDDAFVRRAHLNWIHQGKEYPSFDLLVYRAAAKAGIHTRPVQGRSLLINFRGAPRTFTTIPYYQVLRGEVLPEEFSGKIVLVGATSPVLHDQFPTPFASHGDMPGVEIHANVLETLIRGIPLVRIHGLLAVAFMLAASLLAVWAGNRMRPLVALGTVGLVAGLSLGAGFVAFVRGRLWADVAAVQVALVLGYGASVVENFIREQREKKRLARFFSPAVVTEIIRHRKDETMGSARRLITVLFSDIRGFTSLSEKLPPEQVVEILTEYLTDLTEVVFRHGGTVDKYVGDCIMALYNVPLAQPDHAARAVRTAIEFQQRMRALSARWEAKLGGPLRAGVGINTGDAVVGTMGARQRLEYTAIGDTVNLASRLESLTKEFTRRSSSGRRPIRTSEDSSARASWER